MVQEWFREHGMGAPIRYEAIRLYGKGKGKTVDQIYQDFQNWQGDVRYKNTPKSAIENWIDAQKKKKKNP
jgi:hypothetical protein